MKRKIMILLSTVMVLIMILSACGTPQSKDKASAGAVPSASASPSASGSSEAASENNPVVAEIDGQSVYFADLLKWYIMSYYANLETSSDTNAILDDYMSYKVENAEFQTKGYLNLSPDDITAAQKNVSDFLTGIEQQSEVTEDQVLSQMGVTKDELTDFYKFQLAEANAKKALTSGQTPTDDQIKTQYDTNVANDKKGMDADPTVYTSDVISGSTVYYVPAGVRMVKRILIPLDSDTTGAIQSLRGQYDKQADVLLNDGLSKIQSTANEAYNAIKTGKMTFDQALAQYGKDTDMSADGYPVVKGASDLGDTFTAKALALSKVGDISDLFSTDDGYQIIQYTADKAQGPVSLDDVKDEISSTLMESQQGDAWTKMVAQWKTDHKVTCNYDAMPAE